MIYSLPNTKTQLSNDKIHSPLSNHLLFESKSLEEIHEFSTRTLCSHTLNVSNKKSKPDAQFYGLFLENIAVFNIRYGSTITVAPTDENDCFFTYTPIKGSGEILCRDKPVVLQEGYTTVISPHESYKMNLSKDCSRLVVMLKRDLLEQHLSRLINAEITKPLFFDLHHQGNHQDNSAWLRTLSYICNHYNLSPHLLTDGFRHHFSEMLTSLLLNIQPHNYSHLLNHSSGKKNPRSIRLAITYIEENITRPISVTELASAASVTVRTLQNGFHRHIKKSPSEYIRSLRLSRVHESILEADSSQSITEIMLNNGVTNTGYFIQFYKQRYNCTPSETLKRSCNRSKSKPLPE